jgi:hypothetical protein
LVLSDMKVHSQSAIWVSEWEGEKLWLLHNPQFYYEEKSTILHYIFLLRGKFFPPFAHLTPHCLCTKRTLWRRRKIKII